MSYVLHVWEHDPLPTHILAAAELHRRLSAQRGDQNPKFIAFAKQLTERYPCDSDENDDDLGGVWSDGPLDGITSRAVYSLGIQTVEVMPFLVECANRLGLTVYNDQAGEAYLPGGRVLTLPGQPPSLMDVPYVPDPNRFETRAQIAEVIMAGLQPLMEESGFSATGFATFERANAEVFFEHFIDTGMGYFNVSMHVWVYPNLSEEILTFMRSQHLLSLDFPRPFVRADLKRFSQAASEERQVLSFVGISGSYGWSQFKASKDADLVATVERIKLFLKEDVLPIVDECGSLERLDHYLNNPNLELRRFEQDDVGLIVAHVTGNPRTQEVAAEISALDPYRFPEKLPKILSFLATLDTHGGKAA